MTQTQLTYSRTCGLACSLALALLLASPLGANEPPPASAAPTPPSVTSEPLPELPPAAPASSSPAPTANSPERLAVEPSPPVDVAVDAPGDATEAQPIDIAPPPPPTIEGAQDQAADPESGDGMLDQARDMAGRTWESVKQGTADAVEVGWQVADRVWTRAKEIAGQVAE